MNKNANSVRHLQNAAIAVLTVSAVFLLVQTPLVGDLAGKTPYELAQDWLAGDTSAETSVATDLTELALPVRVAFTNEYARYGLSAITTLDADFELAGAFSARRSIPPASMRRAAGRSSSLRCMPAASISTWKHRRRSMFSVKSSVSPTRRNRRSCTSPVCCSTLQKAVQRSICRIRIRAFLQQNKREQHRAARSARCARRQRNRFCFLSLR